MSESRRFRTWSLVLAAGAGQRLASVTGGLPKQFWRPLGERSLLEQTLARLESWAPAGRTVTLVDQTHVRHVAEIAQSRDLGTVVYQPRDRGTAAGVLLGLSAIREAAPGALVLLSPSDHGVRRHRMFRLAVATAAHHIGRGGAPIVLFGAVPTFPCTDYGWITPAHRRFAGSVGRVGNFTEKPPEATAQRLLDAGAVWNTMVLVARADALDALYRRQLPDLHGVFARARGLPPPIRAEYLAAAYADLPAHDFSRDVLTPARGLGLMRWPQKMGWTDLGTPERLAEWLRRSASKVFPAA